MFAVNELKQKRCEQLYFYRVSRYKGNMVWSLWAGQPSDRRNSLEQLRSSGRKELIEVITSFWGELREGFSTDGEVIGVPERNESVVDTDFRHKVGEEGNFKANRRGSKDI